MVCNFHGFLPKESIIYFSHRRDPRKSVELLYRESREGQILACYRGKQKKNPKTSTIILCLCYAWCEDKTDIQDSRRAHTMASLICLTPIGLNHWCMLMNRLGTIFKWCL